jgi:exopolysaccharide biosynthesis polyprenyl glycosylphosphotransferase
MAAPVTREETAEAVVAAEREAAARLSSPTWPLKLTLRLLLGCGLAIAVGLPVWLAGGGIDALVVALPAIICAQIIRALFVGLSGRPVPAHRLRRTLPAAVLSGSAASILAALLAFAAATDLALPVLAISGATSAALLLAAAAARAYEVRVRAASRRVFFVGTEGQRSDLAAEIAKRGDMRLVGALTGLGGGPAALAARLAAARPTTLVMSAESARDETLVAVASEVHLAGVRVRTLTDFYEQHFQKVPVSDLSQAWFLFDVAEIHNARLYGLVKRAYEAVLAALLLMLSLPLLPALAVAVRASGPGPVLFRQQRVGRNGRLVTLTKFRTMHAAAPDATAGWATTHLSRITPVGRWMRRYRLDEIPQLWHVIRGDLALVGPRPEQPEIVERLQSQLEFYSARHRVRPGLTGWAQVNHGYGGSLADTIEKLQYEFFYIRRQGLRLDLYILLGTVKTVLTGGGR